MSTANDLAVLSSSDDRPLPDWQQAIIDKSRHPTGSPASFSREELLGSVTDRFHKVASQHSQRLAIADCDRQIGYGELERLSSQIAQGVLARLGAASEPVAVLFDHGADGVIAILGVLKANKFYVALDPLHPPAALRAILHDSGARLILTDSAHWELAESLAAGQAVCLDLDSLASTEPTHDPQMVITPEAEAFMIYTSGSTGRPKGVLGHHASILNFVRNSVLDDHISPSDRIGLVNRFSFSGSLLALFSALLTGASLHCFNLKRHSLEELIRWMDREEITVLTAGSAYIQMLGILRGAGNFPCLRLTTCGGEAMSRTHVELMRQHVHPGCILRHALGMTEMKLIASYRLDGATPLPDGLVPIGYPERNVEVFLLDENLHNVSDGEVGEIAVRSPFMTHGYWRRPDLMQERFPPAPDGKGQIFLTGDLARRLPDGCMIHQGRKDFAVKVTGHRVEPGAVEAALGALGLFMAVAVTAKSFGENDTRLTAYLQARGERRSSAELRNLLGERLPEYMVPAYFVYVESMPRNANGKIDRGALPTFDLARQTLATPTAPPATPLEAALVEIWEEALGIGSIGVYDSFLDLGGNSLLATRILTRINERCNVEMALAEFFALPTIRQIAAAVTRLWMARLSASELDEMLMQIPATESPVRDVSFQSTPLSW
jgi:amino acid adenylation domain-containing protein